MLQRVGLVTQKVYLTGLFAPLARPFRFSPLMDFRFAAAGGAAPPFGGHFAVPPFHGSQQPPQRPLYPPIPDPRSAGLTADAAREMKKAQIREEILAREAEEDRLLEHEVRRELQLERAMAERRREERHLGMFRPENRFAEPRVRDSVQPLRAPPPLNAGPYLVPYTPRHWGWEQQGSVQAPPMNLERPESFGVPHCSGESHPIHINYKLGSNNLAHCVEGERLASVHHSGNQGSLLPIFHRLESTAGEHPELGTGLFGRHPEAGVSGWPPYAAHPTGVVGQPIGQPSNSDIRASKSGEDCSGKGKEKSAKESPPASNVVCYGCGNSGHKITSCTSLKGNKKRKLQALQVRDRMCFHCGGSGHYQKDCPLLREKDAPPRPFKFKGKCIFCGGRHHVSDCLVFKKVERNSLQTQKNSGKCFRCGETGHLRKDCPLSDEEAQQKKN